MDSVDVLHWFGGFRRPKNFRILQDRQTIFNAKKPPGSGNPDRREGKTIVRALWKGLGKTFFGRTIGRIPKRRRRPSANGKKIPGRRAQNRSKRRAGR